MLNVDPRGNATASVGAIVHDPSSDLTDVVIRAHQLKVREKGGLSELACLHRKSIWALQHCTTLACVHVVSNVDSYVLYDTGILECIALLLGRCFIVLHHATI